MLAGVIQQRKRKKEPNILSGMASRSGSRIAVIPTPHWVVGEQVVIAGARAGSLIVDVQITGLSEQEVAELVAETLQVVCCAPRPTRDC